MTVGGICGTFER